MESPLSEPQSFLILTSFKLPLQILIQIQMTATISSLTPTTIQKRAPVSASSALDVERQEKREREEKGREGKKGKKQRNKQNQWLKPLLADEKKMFEFILTVEL